MLTEGGGLAYAADADVFAGGETDIGAGERPYVTVCGGQGGAFGALAHAAFEGQHVGVAAVPVIAAVIGCVDLFHPGDIDRAEPLLAEGGGLSRAGDADIFAFRETGIGAGQ